MKHEHRRNQWSSRLGFVLATAGAAIGLGNLWKFPYLMGRNGGFSFLIAYLVFVLVLGIPVMMLEMSLGRHTGKDPVSSYRQVHPKAGITGLFGVLAARLGIGLLPAFLLAGVAGMLLCAERVRTLCGR